MRPILIACLILPGIAFAQSPFPDQTAQTQACQSKLLETIQGELNVRAQAIVWQHEMIAAQQKVKELEAKLAKPEEKK